MKPEQPGLAASSMAKWVYWFAVTAVSAHFAVAYITSTHFYVDINAYASGTAPLPYQYRALTGWLLRMIASVHAINRAAHLLPPPFSNPLVCILTVVNFMSMATAIFVTRRTISNFVISINRARCVTFFFPISCYFSYVSLASSWRFAYPYDITSLALFSFGVNFIVERRLVTLFILFIIYTIDRETSIFLAALYMLYWWPSSHKSWVSMFGYVLSMGAAWIVIKLWLWSLYGANPAEGGSEIGGFFVFQISTNFGYLIRIYYWPDLLSALGFQWIIILIGWRRLDPNLLRAAAILPLWFACMFLVGNLTEVRIFGELSAYVSVASAVIVERFFCGAKEVLPDNSSLC